MVLGAQVGFREVVRKMTRESELWRESFGEIKRSLHVLIPHSFIRLQLLFISPRRQKAPKCLQFYGFLPLSYFIRLNILK